MAEESKRLVEVRLIACVTVDLRHPDVIQALRASERLPSVTEVVAAELSSKLESVPYIAAAVVARL